MSYLKNIDLGYNRNNLIIVTMEGIPEQNLELFKSKLLQNQNIKNVGSSNLIPTHPLWNSSKARRLDGDNPDRVPFGIRNVCTDYDFFDTYQIKIAAGRYFSRKFTTDSSAFILNETAVRELGWGEAQNAVNRLLEFGGEQGRIIGVVKDIHFESLHNVIRPTLFELTSTNMRKIAIKIVSEDFPETIRYIKEVWSEYHPHGIFDYSFLDDTYKNLYRSHVRPFSVF